jgi:hypothetical protein
MGEMKDEQKTSRKVLRRFWIFSGFVKNGVRVTLVLSSAIVALYLAGSMPDPGFSDNLLFLVLLLLRYSSLLLCVFSLFAMGDSVRRLLNRPGIRTIINLFFYFFTGMLGAALSMLYSLISAASAGNI